MNVQGPEGMVFAGKYRINRLIGRGGMANVYLGTDENSGMNVAIKILKPEFSNDEEFIRRFDTEAKAVASLNHANIVKVFGVGHEGNFRYIVQEYVEGITVKELINQNGHLDWKIAVPIVIQVGMALDYAHRNGIIHRDIKPQNILISRDRIAKITDFGIARASTGNTITMSSGGAMGSVHYFSPEQARGGNVGPGSDIYSVGVMLFEMVTGRVPFDGDSNVAIAVKHLQERPPYASGFVPDLPSGLDNIILKCMQKTPEKRYSSMRQMVTELDALMVDPDGVYGVINNDRPEQIEDKSSVSFRQEPSYEKISDIEKSAESRRRSRLRDNILLVLIIVCIVGVLVGLSVLVVTSIRNATQIEKNTDYAIKNYVGMTLNEAKDELEKNHIDYEVTYEVTSDAEAGTVIAQSIGEGVTIKTGSYYNTLVLTVASEQEYIEVPDCAGLGYQQAFTTLTQLGFQVSILPEMTDDVDPDTVIRTEPEAGTQVINGESVVIVYAKEPTSSTVPTLSGMTLEQAREALEEEGLSIDNIDGAPEVRELPEDQQYVVITTPAAGSVIARRSTIRIVVGTMEDVMRGGTPTPTPALAHVETSSEGEGSGTVTGGGDFEAGNRVVITATANEGSRFEYWRDPLGNQISSSTYTFDIPQNIDDTNSNITYVAVFSLLPTPTPVPTATPTPTPTPVPTPTPEPPPPPPETSEELPSA